MDMTPHIDCPASPPEPTPLLARSLGDLLLASAERRGDAPAVLFPNRGISYAELAEQAWGVARSLAGLGVRPGDKVGILMTNSIEMIASFFGVAMLGAVSVSINVRYRSEELRFLVGDAELSAVLTSDATDDYVDFVALLHEALPSLAVGEPTRLELEEAPHLRFVAVFGDKQAPGTLSESEFAAAADAAPAELVTWSQGVPVRSPATIVYTSGTTANPRGAILTHEALVRTWMMVGRRWRITEEDSFWDPCPLFHIAAVGPLVYTIGHGATFLTDTHFDASAALRHIEDNGATLLYPVYPPITQALINHPNFAGTDLSRVRAWLNVGPPDDLRVTAKAIPHAIQISTYGATEGGPVTLHELDDDEESRLTTCGTPLPGNQVRVIDPESREPLPAGVPGEIVYRGYNVFSGYYRDPEKTAASFDADGWFQTGDLGVLDERNRVSFLGRSKEMLKVGGENVAPAEIEGFLGTHPAVHLVQVVGIPDDRLSEVAAAFVELRPGQTADEEELIEFCKGRIASFKVPRVIRFVEEWPMSATKIQKNKLREELLAEVTA